MDYCSSPVEPVLVTSSREHFLHTLLFTLSPGHSFTSNQVLLFFYSCFFFFSCSLVYCTLILISSCVCLHPSGSKRSGELVFSFIFLFFAPSSSSSSSPFPSPLPLSFFLHCFLFIFHSLGYLIRSFQSNQTHVKSLKRREEVHSF